MKVRSPAFQYEKTGFVAAADETRLFYGEAGSGPSLILCDGLGCDGFAWTHLHSRFARSFRVIHGHYRAHGRSGPPQDLSRLEVTDLADDMLTILDHCQAAPAIVCGHSLGTQVCLEMFRKAPEKIAGLILLCGSAGKLTSTFHGGAWLESIIPGLLRLTERYPHWVRVFWSRIPAQTAYRLARMLNEVDQLAMRERDFLSYVHHFRLIDPKLWLRMLQNSGRHDAEDVLATVNVPTLVIAAERDTFTPTACSEAVAKKIRGAKYVVLKRGSHAAPVEQPLLVAEHIER